MIYLGADHRGYFLKEKVKIWLKGLGFDFSDLGAYEYDPTDDYPAFAQKVASLVSKEKGALGILICGSGVGVEVVANKFDGVRAGIGKSPLQVKAARKDDDMNILVLAADFTNDKEAKEMVKIFLMTKFDEEQRHKRRLEEIEKIEANN